MTRYKQQLKIAEDCGLGVIFPEDASVSSVGQADDTILLANTIHALESLLLITQVRK